MGSVRDQRLSANGLTFAADEAGEGNTIALLLHGFPESRESWRGQLEPLAALGWRVVAPDLRGYGQTSRPNSKEEYGIEHLVDDVAALFEAVGARRKILIGHDWGGVIAWQTAIRRRVPLDGFVVLNAPHPLVFQRALNTCWTQRLRSWYVLLFLLPALPEILLTWNDGHGLASALRRQSPGFPDDLLRTYRRNIRAPGAATAMLNYYRANALSLIAPLQSEPIQVPTLMIWGENDEALDLSLTEGNEAFVQDFTLRRLAGVSHWVLHEAPDLVNAAIRDWAQAKDLSSG